MKEKAVMVAEETTEKKLGSNTDYEGLAHLF